MYTASIKLPATLTETDIARLSAALADEAGSHSILREGNDDRLPWILQWIMVDAPDSEDLLARLALAAQLHDLKNLPDSADCIDIQKLPDIDWLAHSYQQFPPFSIGDFFIYGSHYDGAAPDAQIGLQIDAATAFGSGEHGTTAGCLQAMQDLKEMGVCPWNVLDMGTGSGILGIAAYKLWKSPVLAVDNDPEAVRVAQRHAQVNDVKAEGTQMICAAGDGFHTAEVQNKKPFDLIIANILAGVLREMAKDLGAVCDENGYVILSGILHKQAEEVIRAYEAQGLHLHRRYEIGNWSTLVLHNAAA